MELGWKDVAHHPVDAKLELVSRTVGIDRIVDEFLFECTHGRVIDWLYVFFLTSYLFDLSIDWLAGLVG